MIVRIATEGQYEIKDENEERLNGFDREAVSAGEAGDEQQFRAAFDRLLEFVRTHGTPVAEERLEGSDVILPPPDTSVEEARGEFTGEGLIPG